MQTLVGFFNNYKELLAFIFSFAALAFSLVAYFQKSKETVRTLRSQLADTIMKLLALKPQLTDLDSQIDKPGNTESENRRLSSLRSSYSEQRLALAQLAVFLMTHEEIKQSLISDVEYAAVADAFNGAGEIENSQAHWEKALNASKPGAYQTKLTGLYADFLYRRVGFDEARAMYKRAARLPNDPNDALLWEVIWIYARWSRLEAEAEREDDAVKLWKKAIDSCNKIKNQNRRLEGHDRVLRHPPDQIARKLKVT